jgi:hypothetical protein
MLRPIKLATVCIGLSAESLCQEKNCLLKCKFKAVPQHTYGGAGGKDVSSYSFLTSALDGVGGQRHATAAHYPR